MYVASRGKVRDRVDLYGLPIILLTLFCFSEKDGGSAPQQQQKAEKILAVPWDWRIPLIRIQTRQFSQLSNQRIVVNIDSWDINSTYPTGHYVRSLGEIGLAETDVQTLLVENQISYSEFGPNMMSSLP